MHIHTGGPHEAPDQTLRSRTPRGCDPKRTKCSRSFSRRDLRRGRYTRLYHFQPQKPSAPSGSSTCARGALPDHRMHACKAAAPVAATRRSTAPGAASAPTRRHCLITIGNARPLVLLLPPAGAQHRAKQGCSCRPHWRNLRRAGHASLSQMDKHLRCMRDVL